MLKRVPRDAVRIPHTRWGKTGAGWSLKTLGSTGTWRQTWVAVAATAGAGHWALGGDIRAGENSAD